MFGHLTIAVIFIGGGVAVAISNPEETCVTNGHIYEKGDKWQPLGECAEATCTGNNDYSKLRLVYCSFVLHCITEETCVTNGHIYEKGDKWQPLGECAEATCTGNNDYSKLGCPKIAVDKKAGWTLSKEDPSQSYPACCPQPVPPKNGNKKTS
ncbi:uncharacterized protein LOC124361414 [Homalodisca vitripennis]|uniref:uncharacterized protein LOC124361414 n=1 Tax=Homalodisca vitripennis TaxID=197043 RepID=UPI001EEA0F08|nr:uncharacterized protein LOC124361414 [Homalodisca vitripennis]